MVWKWNGSEPKYDEKAIRRLRTWALVIGLFVLPLQIIGVSVGGLSHGLALAASAPAFLMMFWLLIRSTTDQLVYGKPWPAQDDPFKDPRKEKPVYSRQESAQHLRAWMGRWIWAFLAYIVALGIAAAIIHQDLYGLIAAEVFVAFLLVPLLVVIIRTRSTGTDDDDRDEPQWIP